MSSESVNNFLAKVSESQELQAEVAKAMEGENEESNLQEAIELASKYGYDFTTDELRSEINARASELDSQLANGELGEEELEAVAGGWCIQALKDGAKYTTLAVAPFTGIIAGSNIAHTIRTSRK